MQGEADIAAVAAVLADPTRVMLLYLLSDGRAFTTNELAKRAKVAPSTASEHLKRLVALSLIAVEPQGRHHYYRLRDGRIVALMEHLACLAPSKPIRSLSEAERTQAVRLARTCYNHLAGALGVQLTEALVNQGILHPAEMGYLLHEEGIAWCERFGIRCEVDGGEQVLFAPWHLDWSERRHHLAGKLAVALCNQLLSLQWLVRSPNSRAVHVTELGRAGLQQTFGIDFIEYKTDPNRRRRP
jgi:DNA-binding transcriptional ArsR family regulator